MFVDLHIHTTFSDGDMTPIEAYRTALEKNKHGDKPAAIAFTDHDTTAARDTITDEDLDEKVILFRGAELSTIFEAESVHLLAYFLGVNTGYQQKEFQLTLRNTREVQYKRRELQVRRLNLQRKKGAYPESAEDLCFERIMDSFVGKQITWRPIADSLVELGFARDFKEARRIIDNEGYVSYGDGELKEIVAGSLPHGILDTAQGVDFLSHYADIIGLAHPGTVKNHSQEEVENLILKLSSLGLNAVEVYNKKHTSADQEHYNALAQQHRLLVLGGSDAMSLEEIGCVDIPYSVLDNLLQKEIGSHK
jgi:predicted metal-dependent phosphoesterase TrpH